VTNHQWRESQRTHAFAAGMLIENRKSGFWFYNRKPVLLLWQLVFEFIFLSFSSRKLHKNCQMSAKIYLHICLILSVYKSFIKRSNMAGKETI